MLALFVVVATVAGARAAPAEAAEGVGRDVYTVGVRTDLPNGGVARLQVRRSGTYGPTNFGREPTDLRTFAGAESATSAFAM